MSARFEQGGNLHGVVRLTSIEGMRPAESVKPPADEMAALKVLLDSMRNPPISSTTNERNAT